MPEEFNDLARRVLDAAFRVHRALGPGLLESVYVKCFVQALRNDGLHVDQEVWLPLEFEGAVFEKCLRMDLLVENQLIVEVKAVETLHAVHVAQTLTYLRLCNLPLGLLINFHVTRLQHGIRRLALTRRS